MSRDELGAARRAVGTDDPFGCAIPMSRPVPRGMVTGVDVRTLPAGTEIMVDTHNSRYRLVMGTGSTAIVQGGPYFEEPSEARIEGSALAGSLVKVGWIGIGFLMEMTAGGMRVVTSRIRSICVGPDPALTDSAVSDSAA